MQRQKHAQNNNGISVMTAAMFDNPMICDVFWEGHILLLSWSCALESTKRSLMYTRIQQALEEVDRLNWSIPDS